MWMGFMDDAVYEQGAIQFEPGDLVVLYTDGVTDATDEKQESYGLDRFRAVIETHLDRPAVQILSAVEQSIHDFIGSTAPYDDITLLIARHL
jgi:sigma-B regulation protein RsbU (phosphoserine phosphatase)